jgi:multidrug resistance efflux pump
MKIPKSSLQVVFLLCACATSVAQQPNPNQREGTGWLKVPDCFLVIENSVEVPAEETGRMVALKVALNESIPEGSLIAILDSKLSESELKTAKLQYKYATEAAADHSDIDFNELALKEARQELENYKSIGKSATEFEKSRLALRVASAQTALQRSQQAFARSAVEAKLREVAVEVAEQRVQRARIVAPINGVVFEIIKRPGQWVRTGDPVVRLCDLENLVVDCFVDVDQIDLRHIVGSEVQVEYKSSSTTNRLAGTISSYDPEVSRRGLIRLHAKILNRKVDGQWLLLPGMNTTLYIAAPTRQEERVSRR